MEDDNSKFIRRSACRRVRILHFAARAGRRFLNRLPNRSSGFGECSWRPAKHPVGFQRGAKTEALRAFQSVQHTMELFSFGEDKSHVMTFGVANSARGVAG